MKVRKGYKQTELGEIPEDWHFKTFVEVMKGFSSGQTPSRSVKKYYTGKIPWITSGELNYNVITDTIEKITEDAAIKTHLKILPVGTFLMAITGLEAEGTRGSCGLTGVPATSNQSCMALYPNNGELTTEYLFQFYVKYGNWLAFKYCQGTKQQSYTGKIAKTLPIILPPTVEEQNAITTALNETDEFIFSLEKLIEKKQNIKQGTMQVLLTGKKRLKGYKGEWEMKKFGEVADINKGQLITAATVEDGTIPVIAGGKQPAYFHSTPNRLGKTIAVSGSGASAGYVSFHSYPIFASDCSTIQESKTYSIEFLFFFLQLIQTKIYKMQTGGAQPHIHPSDLFPIEIFIPVKEEQTAIANILIDMDAEISVLQNQLSKSREVKQGMMQNLLTGKIRLSN
jgi:type I restriction enzyme, S subunit